MVTKANAVCCAESNVTRKLLISVFINYFAQLLILFVLVFIYLLQHNRINILILIPIYT